MNDWDAVMAEISAKHGKEEISDACARTIASMYHNGQASIGYSFVSTGEIRDASALWSDLTDNGHAYNVGTEEEKRALDMLGAYFVSKGRRSQVAGWSDMWVSKRAPERVYEGTPLDEIPHADYPHKPGRLHDCPRCESECFCADLAGDTECVFCASL